MFERQLAERLAQQLRAATLVATPLPLTPEIRLYLLGDDYPQGALTDQERQSLMDHPPYWAFCWSSGQVLAEWIMAAREELSGKRVLDFGAGSGIVAIAAAMAGAREVIALDTDPLAREAIVANARLNRVTVSTAADLDAIEGDFDLILVADVLYDRSNVPLLVPLTNRGKRVVVADSRLDELPQPYARIGSGLAVTRPDLDEPKQYRHVGLFASG